MSDIVTRLFASMRGCNSPDCKDCKMLREAAAELTALRAKVKSQAEALAPFAEAAEWWSDLAVGFNRPNSEKLWEVPTSIKGCGLTVGDLRRAQEATDE